MDLGLSVRWQKLNVHLCLKKEIALSCVSDHNLTKKEGPLQGLSLILGTGALLYPAAPVQKAPVVKFAVENLDFAQDASPK